MALNDPCCFYKYYSPLLVKRLQSHSQLWPPFASLRCTSKLWPYWFLVEGQRWGCLPEQVARQSRTHSCLVFWTNGSSCSLIYPENVLGTSSYTLRGSWPALAVVVCSAFYSLKMGVSLTCCPCPALFSHIMCLAHCWDVNVVRMWEVVEKKTLIYDEKEQALSKLEAVM